MFIVNNNNNDNKTTEGNNTTTTTTAAAAASHDMSQETSPMLESGNVTPPVVITDVTADDANAKQTLLLQQPLGFDAASVVVGSISQTSAQGVSSGRKLQKAPKKL